MKREQADYLKLQNGSDIRGVALEGVPGEAVNLTVDIVSNIATAFADFLAAKKGIASEQIKVGIGHDSRLSADSLKQAAVNGFAARGCQVYDCGLTPTPSMFMSTILDGFTYDGAVMLTASHLPFNRNGMKFFTNEGGLEKSDIRQILERAAEISGTIPTVEGAAAVKSELLAAYIKHLQEIIKKEVNAAEYDQPLKGLHIVVDGSNGVGGYFPALLEPLGASTTGSIFLNPDGTFPNHVPNPEDKAAMEAIKGAVLGAKADLGVIFDTDGDRAAVVFANGEEINKNVLIALMAAILAEKHPHTTVVTDSVTSTHLADFLEGRLQMKHHRFKRGYKNVINEAVRLNQAGEETHLAIETSGHGALKENYFLDDGAYISVKIICKLAQCKRDNTSMESMVASLKKAAESKEYRIKIQEDDFKKYGEAVLEDFKAFAAQEDKFSIVEKNFEGVRVNYQDAAGDGWMLLRMSLHDPLLAFNIESDVDGGVDVILARLRTFLQKYTKLSQI